MQKLVEGLHQFQSNIFGTKQKLFESLADGQEPTALFITCSDSRIDPNLLLQADPGELFVLRNAGNIVPPYRSIDSGEAATIEYAVKVLGVTDIIVCGHSQCGAMGGLLNPGAIEKLPAVRAWLDYAETTKQIVEEKYSQVTDASEKTRIAVEENVLVQLEHLKTHPSVASALKQNKLKLHGWVYKFETGDVFHYSPERSQFALLDDQNSLSPISS